MTYRDDHEAAIERIDVLERDNALLAAENQSLKDHAPSERGVRAVPWLVALGVVVIAGTWVLATKDGDSPNPPVQIERPPATSSVEGLEACVSAFPPKALRSDFDDEPLPAPGYRYEVPHRACSVEVQRRLALSIISDEERALLRRWLETEHVLADEVGHLTNYYASAGDRSDVLSKQLWLDYDRAYAARREAIKAWGFLKR